MSKITIIEPNTNDKEQVKAFMVKGEKGDTGFSPTLTVSKSNGVAIITITDEDGTKTVQISDGELTKAMVIDNLTSIITDQPLSAKQGKVLKDYIDNVYTKTEADSLLDNKQNTVLSGTSDPSSSLGSNGDIYLQYSE